MGQLGFYVDLAACSGCKACQVACQDRHDLEPGRRFRRVIEVEGGDWGRQGEAWVPTAFAYSVSMSCMHCERPACVDVCPTSAMTKGADGIVTVNQARCIGCRYCEWACPYGALSYSEQAGRMAKCDFCRDDLARGLAPTCVAACPLRVLEFGEIEELRARHGSVSAVFPLPPAAATGPALVLSPHAASRDSRLGAAAIANREEI